MNINSSNETLVSGGIENAYEPCYQLQIIGVYCLLLFIVSLTFNILLLMALHRTKHVFTPRNYFTACLGVVNLVGTLLELPVVAISSFNCRFIFARNICAIEGFVMYFTGCLGVYILVLMSLERFFVIYKPMNENVFTHKITTASIALCVALSLIWCLAPSLGWSHYSLEGVGISCSVEWQEKSNNVVSYNVTILFFVYLLPLLVIIVTNARILVLIRRFIRISEGNYDFEATKKQKFRKERQIFILTLTLILGLLVTWSPYALVAMYTMLAKEHVMIPQMLATIPGLFAKLSLLWPSFLNVVANRDIRLNLPFKYTFNKILPFSIDTAVLKTTKF